MSSANLIHTIRTIHPLPRLTCGSRVWKTLCLWRNIVQIWAKLQFTRTLIYTVIWWKLRINITGMNDSGWIVGKNWNTQRPFIGFILFVTCKVRYLAPKSCGNVCLVHGDLVSKEINKGLYYLWLSRDVNTSIPEKIYKCYTIDIFVRVITQRLCKSLII